jgi:hypothetical protein
MLDGFCTLGFMLLQLTPTMLLHHCRLINVAGLDKSVAIPRKEAGMVVGICKRLPLTIGIAGKILKQMALTNENDWHGIVEVLREELTAKRGDETVEEGVIRVSVNAIPAKIRSQVVQLFVSFALIPEDVIIPLEVMGMLYDSCGPEGVEPIPRLKVRHYLKVLIDRSLVMGTVDGPQLFGGRFG